MPLIGGIKLTELTADDVDDWLEGRCDKLATNTLREEPAREPLDAIGKLRYDRVLRNIQLIDLLQGTERQPAKRP